MPRKPVSKGTGHEPTYHGVHKVSMYHNGNDFTYQKVPVDADGWADATKYLPIDYDLCQLMVEGYRRPVRGWAVGIRWEGFRIKDGDKVICWKRCKEMS